MSSTIFACRSWASSSSSSASRRRSFSTSSFKAIICACSNNNNNNNEKPLEKETQTLRAGCSKAEPKIFAPSQTPFLGAQDGQNLISWRWSLPSPTDPVWWRSMHAISSYRGNRPTNKQTHPQTHRQDRLQYTALQLACRVTKPISIAPRCPRIQRCILHNHRRSYSSIKCQTTTTS